MYSQGVNKGGITFPEKSPITQKLSADMKLENNNVEGPWKIFRDPFYFLFYSRNGH